MSGSTWQEVALAVVPKFSAALSIIGSGWIVFEVLRDRSKLKLVYHRLLLGMSISDVVLSFSSFFLTTWPIPSSEEGVFANYGSMATCQAQGFFVQLSAPYSLYNAYLATYYVLLIRYNWKEPALKKVEYAAHAFTFLFSLGTAIAAIPLGLYNNYVNALCWISESPMGCVGDECVRGKNAIVYQYTFYFVWIWGSLIIVALMMAMLYWTVLERTQANLRYASAPTSSRKDQKKVAHQAFFYIAAYYLVNLFPTIQLIIKSITGGGYFGIYIMNGFFFPMQGLFNCLIYLRPRYMRYRKENPDASVWVTWKRTLEKPIKDSQRRSLVTQMSTQMSTLQISSAEPSVAFSNCPRTSSTPNYSKQSTPVTYDPTTDSLDSSDKGQAPMADCIDLSNQRMMRLVEWNVDLLHRKLQNIASMRLNDTAASCHSLALADRQPGTNVRDEIRDIIVFPEANAERPRGDADEIDLSEDVKEQLRNFVSTIASMYHANPFHSFEHASRVTQAASELLARVETSDQGACHGVSSEIVHFAVIFSALIHDADHSGCPNESLVKEEAYVARKYNNESVAEQNSFDLAWNLLMEPGFADLRSCIFQTQEELNIFRQLVVNCVMATDFDDEELVTLREERWGKAFPTEPSESESALDDANRKATVIIENIIQVSDVSYTMQPWHIYIKWNEKLFGELYAAYAAGRIDKDPSDGWYERELEFFDSHLIPLATKLQDCGLFGTASGQYLSYASDNRREWERRGQDIVLGYIKIYADKKQ